MRASLNRALFLVFVVLFVVSAVSAQILTGSISGTVVDPSDAVVPGASVVATDLATGKEYRTTTNAEGSFRVLNLPNGFYQVAIETPGFAKFVVPKVQVNVSQVANIFAKIELEKTGTEIVIRSEQSAVQTESPEIKFSVDRAQIINLPLPTRNPLDLVRTMPGVATPTSSGIADSFVHGLRGNATNITQDGINVADNFVKTSSFFSLASTTVDSTGEFNVSIGGIGADAGFGAAQVSIRTQRGSNEFHGSLFWFQRTNFLNANTWFNNAAGNPRPFQLQNRIGASAGGPVYIPKVYDGRNRTWVFGTYEAFREPLSRSRTRTVLAPDARNGMFTYTPTCTTSCPSGVTAGQPRTVNLLTLTNITTTTPTGPVTITPAINTFIMNFYNSLVPDPNTDAGCTNGDKVNIRCFQFNLPGKGKQDRYTIRADHQLTPNHAIEFVFNQADFDSTPDLLNGIEPNFPKSKGGAQTSRRQVFVWAWQGTFGANKTNELRGGYTRAPVGFDLFEDYSATNGIQILTPGVLTDPTITSTNLPQGRNTPVRQIMDNFGWVKGRHTFRFGGEYRRILANSYFFNTVVPRITLGTNSANSNGLVSGSFPGGITSGDLTRAQTVFNMITAMVGGTRQGFNHTSPTSGFVPGVPRTIDPVQNNLSFYWQDGFAWRRNLTLTFGVRWEYQGVFDLRNGLILQPTDREQGLWGPSPVGGLFDPTQSSGLTDVMLDFAGGHNGKPIYDRDLNNWAPFLGFAWDPWNDSKTSIRGSGAVHFTQDGFTLFQLSSTGNTGLFSVPTSCDSTVTSNCNKGVTYGVYDTSNVALPAVPTASFPVSQRANFIADTTNSALWYFDDNLRTPYVVEWNLSVTRELWKRLTIEVRYVGNHAVKQFRSFSINELNLLNSPFTCTDRAASGSIPALTCGGANGVSAANLLNEFISAQQNLAIYKQAFPNCGTSGQAGNPCRFSFQGLPNQNQLPIFTALFQGLSGTSTSGFASSTFGTQLEQNQIGAIYHTLRTSNTYRANREANFPLNYFVANPFAAAANMVGNPGWSYYNGLEVEVRRRFSGGLYFQANYTFGKVLTDTRFLTSQQENQNYLSLLQGGKDKNRAAFDTTHSVAANFIYPLPIGKGKWLGRNASGVVDKLIGGWQVQGFTRIASGAPMNITSPRLTTGSRETMTAMLRNMTPSELQSHIGVFQVPQGVFWLDPNSGLLSLDSATNTYKIVKCTPGQTTPCFDHPGVNEFGNLPYFGLDAPKFVNQDLSIIKRTGIPAISEQFNFEIRFEFFNAFNHPNFGSPTTDIDLASFGQLTNTVDTVRGGGVTSRIIQWAIRVNW